jgi:hypothetical protein
MNNEARERDSDRWPGNQSSAAEVLEGSDIAADPSFVKAAPIDIRGPWRKAYHCNYWWVAGHHMLHPCRNEREAEKLCGRLKDDWKET